MRALIVDDSRATRRLMGRILRELGLEVAEAANGREALARLAATRPDFALVDWHMPEMDGFEFVCAVRANPEWANLRVLMVTTETEMSQVARALDAGANEYIMKPFTQDMIREKLELLEVRLG
ncbi:MAG TPA: response regulator [Gemmatimonadales bacterium]|nr:response regulator [Gemmatimonadales bacterium]